MKISDFKGEEGIILLADILDPATEIMSDEKVMKLAQGVANESVPQLSFVSVLLKNHAKSILKILALLNKKDVETYNPSIVELTKEILEMLDDEELMNLFHSQGLLKGDESSISALENIEE